MARPVRIDDLFRLILPGSPALSPDGESIAFAIKRIDAKENRYVSHLWIMTAKGGKRRQLTHGLVSDTSPVWSPDGRQLAFVSDRGEKSNVWLLPLDGGEPRQLTDLAEGGPITALSWSPDGKEILFGHLPMPKPDPEKRKKQATFKHITRLYHKEDGIGWFGDAWWTIRKVNAKTGRTVELTRGDHHDHLPSWSPDSKRIVFLSNRNDDADLTPDLNDVWVMDRNGRGAKRITKKKGSRDAPCFGLDGKHVYWVGYEGGSGEWLDHEHTVHRAPASGSGDAAELNVGHDRWAMNMVGSDTTSSFSTQLKVYRAFDGERVLFGSDEDGSYRLYSVPADGGDVRLELGGKVSVLGLSVPGRDSKAVACVATNDDTGELYALELDGSASPRKLTGVTAPFFRPLSYNLPEEVRVKSGKLELQGWVLKPPSFRKGKKYPCLVEVHGGPMTQYGEAWFHEMQVLAAKGWIVAYCNPRGSSGRGRDFCRVIEGEWGKKDWADIQAFTDWVEKQPWADKKRIGILGGSYGGYMTCWALGHTDRYKAAVSQRNACDFWVHWGSSDFGWFRSKFFDGKHPWDDPKAYHEQSPAFYAKNFKTPMLIIHSEGDLRCPIAESEMMFTALKVLGKVPTEMVRFEGEFHGLSRGGKPRNREERLKRIVDWFERYL
jgi:dipeptidyl aminopeptidase/acylaminoacyl peptidase